MLNLVREYDVDGLHLDYIRYPERADGQSWGYNETSIARFNARNGRTGRPPSNDPLWNQWRRDQVTALVRGIYLGALAIKPEVKISAAVIPWGDGPTHRRRLAEDRRLLQRLPGLARLARRGHRRSGHADELLPRVGESRPPGSIAGSPGSATTPTAARSSRPSPSTSTIQPRASPRSSAPSPPAPATPARPASPSTRTPPPAPAATATRPSPPAPRAPRSGPP